MVRFVFYFSSAYTLLVETQTHAHTHAHKKEAELLLAVREIGWVDTIICQTHPIETGTSRNGQGTTTIANHIADTLAIVITIALAMLQRFGSTP
jgi:hypothetical protein